MMQIGWLWVLSLKAALTRQGCLHGLRLNLQKEYDIDNRDNIFSTKILTLCLRQTGWTWCSVAERGAKSISEKKDFNMSWVVTNQFYSKEGTRWERRRRQRQSACRDRQQSGNERCLKKHDNCTFLLAACCNESPNLCSQDPNSEIVFLSFPSVVCSWGGRQRRLAGGELHVGLVQHNAWYDDQEKGCHSRYNCEHLHLNI